MWEIIKEKCMKTMTDIRVKIGNKATIQDLISAAYKVQQLNFDVVGVEIEANALYLVISVSDEERDSLRNYIKNQSYTHAMSQEKT